jgi:tRNA threonylcarbamoyladenosine biosynthesis protein TsaB
MSTPLVLAIDTASRQRALCVLAAEDGALLDHRALTGRDLDRALLPALAQLLRDDLAAVACVMGPGSFTGLRVGIAAALGIAHTRGLPLYGIPALDVVALAAPDASGDVEAVADAGRGALYVTRYRRDGATLRLVGAPHRIDTAAWSPAAGATAVSLDGIPRALDAAAAAPVALARAAAAALAGEPLALAGLEPVYLSGRPAQPPERRV